MKFDNYLVGHWKIYFNFFFPNLGIGSEMKKKKSNKAIGTMGQHIEMPKISGNKLHLIIKILNYFKLKKKQIIS